MKNNEILEIFGGIYGGKAIDRGKKGKDTLIGEADFLSVEVLFFRSLLTDVTVVLIDGKG